MQLVPEGCSLFVASFSSVASSGELHQGFPAPSLDRRSYLLVLLDKGDLPKPEIKKRDISKSIDCLCVRQKNIEHVDKRPAKHGCEQATRK